MTQKVIIIGGVAGGATARCEVRGELAEEVEIVVIERGEYISLRQLWTYPIILVGRLQIVASYSCKRLKGMSGRFRHGHSST